MTTVAIRKLRKTFPGRPAVTALCDATVDIASGELFAILGPSGCGKTTLLRMIAGFERPDAGTIDFDGVTVSSPQRVVAPERRRVGIVPQEGGLFPHLDVADNIGFGLRRLDRRTRLARVDELLELIALPHLGRRRPHQLSGGQQQRVALARALAPRPAVVLLDEPFAALDTSLRAELRDDVAAVLRATSTTAVLVTHDQVEALTTADTVAVMRDGDIVQTGPPQSIYRSPADLDTARFLGDCTIVPGVRTDRTVVTALGRLAVADHVGDTTARDVSVMIRPEQIVRQPTSPVTASVRSVRFEGAIISVILDIGTTTIAARWPAIDVPEAGAIIAVGVAGPVPTYSSPAP